MEPQVSTSDVQSDQTMHKDAPKNVQSDQTTQAKPEDLMKQMEDMRKINEELSAKVEKMEKKEYNFSKVRKKAEKFDELSEKEQFLVDGLDDLSRRQQEIEQRERNSNIEIVLNSLVGKDEDLRKQVLFNYERLNDKADTYQEVYNKMKDAYKMTGRTDAPRGYESMSSMNMYNQPYSQPQQDKVNRPSSQNLRNEVFKGKYSLNNDDVNKYGKNIDPSNQNKWNPSFIK